MESSSGRQQMRLIHIIYILSTTSGRIEHPHLIRIRHHNRNGVCLRDIKRWIGELRGRYMPESFAWSYKRRYKSGYVWQDLMDDDLITPLSDNEYVLKGTEIIPTPATTIGNQLSTSDCVYLDPTSYTEQTASASILKEDKYKKPLLSATEPIKKHHLDSKMNIRRSRTKSCSEISEESAHSSEISTMTDDTVTFENTEQNSHEEHKKEKATASSSSSFHVSLLNSKCKNRKMEKMVINDVEKDTNIRRGSSSSSFSQQSGFTRSKSYSDGASQALLNWLPCKSADTDAAALVSALNCDEKTCSKKKAVAKCETFREKLGRCRIFSVCWDCQPLQPQRYNPSYCKDELQQIQGRDPNLLFAMANICGCRRSCGGVKNGSYGNNYAAYKQLNEPFCKQCGKPVRPESWIRHVQSCKQTKALLKKTAASSKRELPRRSLS